MAKKSKRTEKANPISYFGLPIEIRRDMPKDTVMLIGRHGPELDIKTLRIKENASSEQ